MRRSPWLLVISLLLAPVAYAEEEEPTRAGIYILDSEDLVPQMVRASLRQLDELPPEATPEGRQQYRNMLESEGESAARGWMLVLLLAEDGTFRTLGRRSAPRLGSRAESREGQGTWQAEPDGVQLEPAAVDQRAAVPLWPTATVVGKWEVGGLRFPAPRFGKDDETTFLLRTRTDVDASLLSLTPAERTVHVRASLPAPTAEAGFTFRGDIFALLGSPLRMGTLELSVQADVAEGRPVWRVEETWDRGAGGEWKRTVAWLDADLGLLRQQTDLKRPQTTDPTDVEGHLVTSLTRTDRGYRGSTRMNGGEAQAWEQETEERPLTTLGALVLFLRGCPDLPIAYECACHDEADLLGSLITVEGPGALPSLGRPGTGRPAWVASSRSATPESRGGTAIYLSLEDRRPLAVLAAFSSGVGGGAYGITAPEVLPVRDILRVGGTAGSAKNAAEHLAIGTVWGEPDLIAGVLDWPALYERARARGFAGDDQTFRAELLAKFERRGRSLTLAEGNEVVRAVSRHDGRAPPTGEEIYFEPDAPAAEFAVQARNTPEGWMVVKLHDSIHDETRALGDAWTDLGRPEPAFCGMRLWMWARKAQVREMHNKAAGVLHHMGPDAWPVLAKIILEVGLPDGALDGPTKLWSKQLLAASVPALLLAMEAAGGEARGRLFEALGRRVGRISAWEWRSPGKGLPQPDKDRHPAAIPMLLRTLASDVAPLRWIAARRLASYGAMGREAVPALERALADSDPRVREAAGYALQAARSREVVMRIALPQRYGTAHLYRGEEPGDRVLWTKDFKPFASSVVLAGDFEPGRYTVYFVSQDHAPLVLRDVQVADPITTVGPVFVSRSSKIVVRDRRPRLRVRATHLGAPPYERRGFYVEALGSHLVPHLGAGRFRVVITPPDGSASKDVLLDRVVEVDGEQDLDLELD